ncbi:THUMP domain-containing protein 1 [Senna tora]|uniref:THUMP domain-containing protein 1 n=1 Tax=Senna tora TaxID=362788 RepID=A0A834TUY6_9FABA|nr:THUMP domain-containing protein 1 [Senna tora]
MASESKQTCNPDPAIKGSKRKRYLPHNKPVKKGSYPLRPGVQGFFITCDGGREHQASREALNIIDSKQYKRKNKEKIRAEKTEIPTLRVYSRRNGQDERTDELEVEVRTNVEVWAGVGVEFYEELVHGEDSSVKELSNKPLNTKITFSDSDTSSSSDDGEEEEEVQEREEGNGEKKNKSDISKDDNTRHENRTVEELDPNETDGGHVQVGEEAHEPQAKRQCCQEDVPTSDSNDKGQQKSVDRLIEAELKVLGDKNKRCFVKLDSGCNGVVFVQMRKKDGSPGPKAIVEHMVTSAALKKKHMSRFILRILPIEVACYASEDEISKAIKPLVEHYFPMETQSPQKFAVLYEARANSGIDRMKIIDTVAKSVPGPHKVDLKNPEKTIVVEIVKTVCLIGVIEKYKEFAKYNLRQLTSRKV